MFVRFMESSLIKPIANHLKEKGWTYICAAAQNSRVHSSSCIQHVWCRLNKICASICCQQVYDCMSAVSLATARKKRFRCFYRSLSRSRHSVDHFQTLQCFEFTIKVKCWVVLNLLSPLSMAARLCSCGTATVSATKQHRFKLQLAIFPHMRTDRCYRCCPHSPHLPTPPFCMALRRPLIWHSQTEISETQDMDTLECHKYIEEL